MRAVTARLLIQLESVAGRLGLGRTPLRMLKPASVTLRLRDFDLEVPRAFIPHYAHGTYEAVTQASFRSNLRPGMTVVDVGTHLGSIALLASKLVGPAGRVHAIEPFEENLHFLRRNVQRNGAENIVVHAVAAGAENRSRTFRITGSSDSNGFFAHPNTSTVRTIHVTERRLDDLIEGPIHAAKIDVEGAELLVLKGMERILAENPDIILWVEWMPACMRNAGFDPVDLPAKLEQLGFRSITVLDDRASTSKPLAEVLPEVSSGTLPDHWYVNLLARRQ
jgi:FkbM family methyltransferase